jgi:pyruvate/2-oxoglutarate dehydrogenase complex dihydrolipoamide acyltransferase (E2) component
MAFEFKLPDIGEGVVEGEIVKWLVKPGDRIQVDQPMVEVMTDKATVVIPSPKAGLVVETRGKEGEIAKVHSILVVIDEQAAAAPAKAAEPAKREAPKAEAPKVEPPRRPEPARAATPPDRAATAPEVERPRTANGSHRERDQGVERPAMSMGAKVLAAPATRRLARELGVDLGELSGTGPAGRVTSEDVRRAAELGGHDEAIEARRAGDGRGAEARSVELPPRAPAAIRLPHDGEGDEHVPVRGLRKRIWDNMAISSHMTARFTFVEECDATDLVHLRDRFNQRLEKGEEKLTFLPFIVKAVISSLKKFPDLNAHIVDEKLEYIRRREYHIGIAVASERGLIVPVVRHADRRSILDIAAEIKRLADAVRSNQLRPEDLGGSTFTITSLGKDGGIFATPIINYPEVAIMGVHKIVKRPMVRDSDQIVIRDMMNLSLSFDHRLIDGHVGAAFTYAVIRLLEQPDRMMMEMI